MQDPPVPDQQHRALLRNGQQLVRVNDDGVRPFYAIELGPVFLRENQPTAPRRVDVQPYVVPLANVSYFVDGVEGAPHRRSLKGSSER